MTRHSLVLEAILIGAATAWVAADAFGEEPAADNPPAAASPQNPYEGLGFSVAPKADGKGRTSLFGLVGEGYNFVYVFDRSGSMGGSGEAALRTAKDELLASLRHLNSVHRFQIIFYNERPVVFNPTGAPGRLAFATDQNKRRAESFIRSIAAQGGTSHMDALRQAVQLQPDVIFFLTDGDEPRLTAEEMDKIERMASGIVINAIEFGPGPKPAEPSFMEDLARRCSGTYVYVDLSTPWHSEPHVQ